MENLVITLVQSDLYWEDKERNLLQFRQILEGLRQSAHLILLPETFSTGFVMNPERYAEEPDGPTVGFLQEMAAFTKASVAGTLMVKENGRYYNRMVIAAPDGGIFTYDKRHLFRLSNEGHYFQSGTSREVYQLNGWRIRPQICYDLRFPVWCRNSMENDAFAYDVLLYLANWPIVRAEAWKTLLVARALENMSYVVGVNRVGLDGNGMQHTGDSMVVDPRGTILFQAPPGEAVIHTLTLDAQELALYRDAFAFHLDWDSFRLP